jgi:membrane protein DedA with SNARE-associated domain
VRRLGPPFSTLALLAALHPHARNSGVDYAGVFLAALATWTFVPGPGEAVLIAAGISAAHHHLSLASVLLVAWAGAVTGAALAWVFGMKAGRALLTAPGPLHRLRLAMIARGERFYERYGPIAVFFTPAWVAGIHDMRWSRFLPASAAAALAWALFIGLGAYFVGPSIADIAADAGLAGAALFGLLVIVAVVLVWRRRARRSG